MANTRWTILLITFIVSCVSFAMYVVSISTANWIEAVANYEDLHSDEIVNYGLFSGSALRQVLATRTRYDLTVICDYSQGACVYSCQESSESRAAELNKILNGEQLDPCPSQPRSITQARVDFIVARDDEIIQNVSNQYIPAGYWVCTVLFLSIAIAFTATSALFSLINMLYSPIEPIFNIFGLYIWNSIAAGSSLIALILWGVLFDHHLIDNIAVTDTLNSKVTFVSNGNASIGFSFYIMIVAFILNLVNIGLLVLRIYLVSRNTEPPTITIDKNDSPLEFY